MAHQQESSLPFSSLAKSLLLPKPRGKKKHPKTSWSSLLSFRTAWSFHLLQNRVAPYFLQSCVVYSLFTSEPRGLPLCMAAGPRYKSQCPYSFAAPFLTPLQPVTPASILVFFQLYWAAIVSLGRCGPMAWSQSSPSSPTGPVTRGSCFPVTSWVEVTPIPLAQSMATAI